MSSPNLVLDRARAGVSAAVDVAATHLYADGGWRTIFAELRRDSPVDYCPTSLFGPYWSVTRYNDIVRVEAQPDIYSSAWENGGVTILDNDPDIQLPMFIAMDRPRHTAQRRTVSPAFSPGELARLASAIRVRTGEVLDCLPVNEPFDWVTHVSTELTNQMLAALLDFPWHDRKLLTVWTEWAGDFRAAVSAPLRRKRHRHLQNMADYFGRLWVERSRAEPGPDLLSRMIHSVGMADLTPLEFTGNLVLLLIGGTETTRSTMTGLVNVMNLFPDEWEKLKCDFSLIPNAVSELIRWQTPLAHMRRTPLEDVELGGRLIRRGEKVVLWYNSANRDEAVFFDGDRFDVERVNARRHLSFGYGIHRCVGARLAELQVGILVEEMLLRGMNVEMLRPPVVIPSPFSNGYRHQLVRMSRV